MFSLKLKELRENAGYSQSSFADAFGTKQSTVGGWEAGVRQPRYDTMKRLADFFNVSVDYLIGRSDEQYKKATTDGSDYITKSHKKGVKIPVLGDVAAGVPIEAIEDVIDYEEIDEDMARQGEFFGLRIKGDSMEPRMLTGDVVIVRQQSMVESGDIAVVLINGDSATVKKVKITKEGVWLIPFNPSHEPMFYNRREVMELPLSFIGKVVELRGKFD